MLSKDGSFRVIYMRVGRCIITVGTAVVHYNCFFIIAIIPKLNYCLYHRSKIMDVREMRRNVIVDQ